MGEPNFPFPNLLSSSTTAATAEETIGGEVSGPDIPYIIVACVICVIGLIGNLIIIFVIVVLKEYKKSVTHWYVLQLAIADTIFLATWPFKLRSHLTNEWRFPEWMCKANETILFLNYYASVIFLVVMSIDRYIVVCQTFSPTFQRLRRRTSAFIVAICVWGFALALTIPVMLHTYKVGFHPACHCTYEFDKFNADQASTCFDKDYEEGTSHLEECLNITERFKPLDNGELYCREHPAFDILELLNIVDMYEGSYDYESGNSGSSASSGSSQVLHPNCHYIHHPIGWKIFLCFNFVVMFLIPFLIMVACCGAIVWKLDRTKMRRTSSASSASFTHSISGSTNGGSRKKRRKTSARSNKNRRRVTILCATLVISFMVCWVPFHAIHLAKFHGIANQTSEYCDWLQRIGSVFAYLTAAINPYLYSFLGTHFLKRWQFATSTVRKSMSLRLSSSSGGPGSARYAPKKIGRENSTSHNQTVMTKINRVDNTAISESKPMTFIGTNYNSEMEQNFKEDSAGTPQPDYEHSLTMCEKDASVFQD